MKNVIIVVLLLVCALFLFKEDLPFMESHECKQAKEKYKQASLDHIINNADFYEHQVKAFCEK
ncbi:hypothetical protein [Bacillus paramycoides]|uniref:hypothetical protein n=1 Tax=Bacillus paramycoides TaxID=2026194 RepID=UPI002E21097E|nr:hypothetical protein [Bacillus paramycoides]